ncbi:hypothetical protein BDBG_17051 [Blastomyces gilchristii SLH14081]|uniref:Uncharacterized protein n=1 Tax=Blastomyces gilchristii (strain SLH14081) TaxID=559298 RepID=A0A179UKG7_BLAGS|nr:uncharacterized protein BDBG_17051 [Blastomyces gilchristii SLH14081]OAT08464.1 hypothetical protein BDBG_17051 [Blastomyces gilchristii SLH14081]
MSQPSEQPVRGIIRSLVEHHQHRNNNHPDKLNEAKESTRRDDGANMLNGIPANRKLVASFPADNDVFCAGEVLSRGDQCAMEVGIVVDHSSGKLRPFLGADCRVHAYPPGSCRAHGGDGVDIYPLMGGGRALFHGLFLKPDI